MKNLYVFALALAPVVASAQQYFSFETSENYTLGPIHNQNGWITTTKGDDTPINEQNVTNEIASQGTQSLKLDQDPDENYQLFPIFGASKELDRAYNNLDTVFEFDAYISEDDGSNFEFTAWGIKDDIYVPVGLVSFNYMGYLEVITDTEYSYLPTDFLWTKEKWYHIKMEFYGDQVKYYANGELFHTGLNFSQADILGINFLHDNFGGFALIDNISVNDNTLATQTISKGALKVYPNPTTDFILIDLPKGEKLQDVEVFATSGQKVIVPINENKVGLSHLSAGTYLVKVTSSSGKTFVQKVIKK